MLPFKNFQGSRWGAQRPPDPIHRWLRPWFTSYVLNRSLFVSVSQSAYDCVVLQMYNA